MRWGVHRTLSLGKYTRSLFSFTESLSPPFNSRHLWQVDEAIGKNPFFTSAVQAGGKHVGIVGLQQTKMRMAPIVVPWSPWCGGKCEWCPVALHMEYLRPKEERKVPVTSQ